jgi:hypothetical protein
MSHPPISSEGITEIKAIIDRRQTFVRLQALDDYPLVVEVGLSRA